ncbi:bacterial surface antigen [Dichotomocladium elegans]|nr:bacterial surface antigen [Dichotomocladium elegans]
MNSTSNDAVDVTFDLREKAKGVLTTSLGVGENEANVNGTIAFRNVFGGAETVHAKYEFGNRTKHAIELAGGIPILGSPDITLEAFVKGSIKDYSLINLYMETSKMTGLRVKAQSGWGQHRLSYAMINRDITAGPKSSALVRAHSGANVKSSVLHSFVRDTRDHVTMPTKGEYISVTQELAGLGDRGDASYFKQEIAAQIHRPLGGNVVLSGGIKTGFLHALDDRKVMNVSDRFYLGGPLSVRGFKMGGIGPREGNDAAGGNIFYAAGISLTTPIPGVIDQCPIKAHAFFNSGNIMTTPKNVPVNAMYNELFHDSRTSVGAGLIFYHELARVEVNFCVPLRFRTEDRPQHGLQFGLGINFL